MILLDRFRGVRGAPGRRRAMALVAIVGMAATALVTATPGAASADVLPANLQKYANCPVDNPDVSTCIFISTDSMQMEIGNWDLNATSPITLGFGLKFDPVTFEATAVAPAGGLGSIMTADPIPVPGGILGIPGTGVGPLAAYGTPTLTALPVINIPNMLQRKGIAISLDLRAKVENPFTDVLTILGSKCHVGSASDPIPLRLTTGTTAPPPPNTPISGARGTAKVDGEPIGGLRFEGVQAVDNSFRAPGAHDCGLTGLLNPVINAQGGLPSPAGTNTAIMHATVSQVDANTVRDALGGQRVTNGGFEDGLAPWVCSGQCGVDQGLGNAHSGANNGWVRKNSGWNDLHQSVSVMSNTDYTLTGWIRTSANNANGYFGVRKADGTVVKEKKFGKYTGYTQVTVTFNSGNNTTLDVFGGLWAFGDTWAQFDDISLLAN